MKKQEKKEYEVPALTVVQFKVERGYAASIGKMDFGTASGNDVHAGQAMGQVGGNDGSELGSYGW